MKTITVQELKKRIDEGKAPRVIDVREGWEYEKDHITKDNIPMGEVPSRIDELGPKDGEIVICCRSGGRSGNITYFLENQRGFTNAYNLEGGMLAWKANIDPDFDVE